VDIDVSLDYGMTLLGALLIGTGFVLQQNAAAREPASRFLSLRLMADLVRSPRWLAGIVAMICGQVLAAWSIGHLTLSVVEPLLTTNLIWALILAVPLSKRARSRSSSSATPAQGAPARAVQVWEVAGAAVLCVGVGLLSSARSAKPIGLSFGSFSHWPAAAAIAAIAFGCVHFGRRRQGRPRALLTGIAAGLVYGIQDALTRQTLEALQSGGIGGVLTSWAPYALVGAGAVGIWLMQSAFSTGPLQLSLPAISAGEPLVGILLGIIVFGDRIQVTPLQLAVEAGGIAALVAGVILVARAPALSHLRTWPPPGIPHGPISLPHPALPHLVFPHRGGSDPEAADAPVTSAQVTSAPPQDGAGANGSDPHEAGPGPARPAAPEALRELPVRAPALAEAPQGGRYHGEAEQQERHHVHASAVLADLPDLEHLGVDEVEHEADAGDQRAEPDQP
jgi:hypothetical protein